MSQRTALWDIDSHVHQVENETFWPQPLDCVKKPYGMFLCLHQAALPTVCPSLFLLASGIGTPRIEFTTPLPVITTEGCQEGRKGSQVPESTSCQAWATGRIWKLKLLDKWILSTLLQVMTRVVVCKAKGTLLLCLFPFGGSICFQA